MRIGVLNERALREKRVALVPDGVEKLRALGHEVVVEAGAGASSGLDDLSYADAGADVTDRDAVLSASGIVLQVRASGTHEVDDGVLGRLTDAHILIGLVDPLWMNENADALAQTGATVLALELVPRITRAQSMDVLSSMATISGYEAVLLAASIAPRMFPMLMTAAGTIPPTRLFVLGAGVAGLQAIATARRLGAVVEAYDVRPAAAEQIRSIGAKAIELDFETHDSEDAGGYAKQQSEDQNTQQQRLLTPFVGNSDVVITTAAIPGVRSPELVTTPMVEAMSPGSVIVDLAAERGGNCSLTKADETVVHQGVTIVGPTDLPSRAARNASQMLSNNIVTLLEHLTDTPSDGGADAAAGVIRIDPDDEITAAMLVATGGEVVHPRVREQLGLAELDALPHPESGT